MQIHLLQEMLQMDYQDVIFSFIYQFGPYFNQVTIREIVEGHSYFTLHFDETVTAQVKKAQMDLLVHCWSEVDNGVRIKFLTSIILDHAKKKKQDVVTEAIKALAKVAIPLKLMHSHVMNEPSVNKSILSKLNHTRKEKGYKQLVKCPPSCLIHVCHNSVRKGMMKYSYNIE